MPLQLRLLFAFNHLIGFPRSRQNLLRPMEMAGGALCKPLPRTGKNKSQQSIDFLDLPHTRLPISADRDVT